MSKKKTRVTDHPVTRHVFLVVRITLAVNKKNGNSFFIVELLLYVTQPEIHYLTQEKQRKKKIICYQRRFFLLEEFVLQMIGASFEFLSFYFLFKPTQEKYLCKEYSVLWPDLTF